MRPGKEAGQGRDALSVRLTCNTARGDLCGHYRMTGQESHCDFYDRGVRSEDNCGLGALELPATSVLLRAVYSRVVLLLGSGR